MGACIRPVQYGAYMVRPLDAEKSPITPVTPRPYGVLTRASVRFKASLEDYPAGPGSSGRT